MWSWREVRVDSGWQVCVATTRTPLLDTQEPIEWPKNQSPAENQSLVSWLDFRISSHILSLAALLHHKLLHKHKAPTKIIGSSLRESRKHKAYSIHCEQWTHTGYAVRRHARIRKRKREEVKKKGEKRSGRMQWRVYKSIYAVTIAWDAILNLCIPSCDFSLLQCYNSCNSWAFSISCLFVSSLSFPLTSCEKGVYSQFYLPNETNMQGSAGRHRASFFWYKLYVTIKDHTHTPSLLAFTLDGSPTPRTLWVSSLTLNEKFVIPFLQVHTPRRDRQVYMLYTVVLYTVLPVYISWYRQVAAQGVEPCVTPPPWKWVVGCPTTKNHTHISCMTLSTRCLSFGEGSELISDDQQPVTRLLCHTHMVYEHTIRLLFPLKLSPVITDTHTGGKEKKQSCKVTRTSHCNNFPKKESVQSVQLLMGSLLPVWVSVWQS